MRLSNYTLSPTRINNAKAKDKLYKLSDGGGLFVEVSPAGQKTWRYQYRFGGSRRDVKIGRYPEVGVADARERHFELRALLERGIDPADAGRQELSERKQRAADAVAPADEFETFSKRWEEEAGGEPLQIDKAPDFVGSSESTARGEGVYAKMQCHMCHGKTGKGDGPSSADLQDSWGDRILPFDFTSGPLKGGSTPVSAPAFFRDRFATERPS